MFPSRFLKAADLKGQDVHLTIRAIVNEEVPTARGNQRFWVMYFDETKRKAAGNSDNEKRFIVKPTNGRLIAKATGEMDNNAWPGKRITLYKTRTGSPQGEVDCIRVRSTAPPAVDTKTGEIASVSGPDATAANKKDKPAETLADVMEEAKR